MKCFSQSLFVLCLWGLLADSPSSADAKPEKFKISEEEQKILFVEDISNDLVAELGINLSGFEES